MGSVQGMWGRKEAMDTTRAPGFGNWEMGTSGDTSLGWGGGLWVEERKELHPDR